MEFAGLNYLAILIGAIAGWLVGAVWYGALFAKPWMAANNLTRKTMQARGAAAIPHLLPGRSETANSLSGGCR